MRHLDVTSGNAPPVHRVNEPATTTLQTSARKTARDGRAKIPATAIRRPVSRPPGPVASANRKTDNVAATWSKRVARTALGRTNKRALATLRCALLTARCALSASPGHANASTTPRPACVMSPAIGSRSKSVVAPRRCVRKYLGPVAAKKTLVAVLANNRKCVRTALGSRHRHARTRSRCATRKPGHASAIPIIVTVREKAFPCCA